MTEIHVITVTHGPVGTQESFFYKTEKKAKDQFDTAPLTSEVLMFKDDFGNEGYINGIIHAIRLSNMEKSLEIQIEQTLMNARAQAKASRAAQSDTVLQLAGAPAGAVSPFPGNRR